MFLIPKPFKIEQSDEIFIGKGVIISSQIRDERLKKAVKKLPLSESGIPLYITGEQGSEEGYRLSITNKSIKLDGDGAPGVFYGIQTLRQILSNKEIYCAEIEDKPGNKYRGFYHDVTRGRVPTVETLKKLIDNMAYYKLNSLQLYVEHAFPFKEMYGTLNESEYLSPGEIREIDEYCCENFIDLIPSLATCGHMYDILQLPENAHLREIENYEPEYTFWYERMLHHTLDPENPESLELSKSRIDQYIPHFRSEYVNICGDEPTDLKIGKHKDADNDMIYFDFMVKIIEHIKSKGKKIMMWADKVFLDNIERLDKLADDITLLCWGYAAEPPETRVSRLENRKNPKLVCPSTSSYFRLVENARVSEANISKMAEYGDKYHADGMLNTNWGDYGHPCSLELSMFGMLVGAEKSWNFKNEIGDNFKNAVDLLLYKNQSGTEYLFELNRLNEMAEFYKFVRLYSNLTCKGHIEFEKPTKEELETASAGCKKIYDRLLNEVWEEE